MATTTAPVKSRTQYKIKAHSVEACNCQHGCNCQFDGFPNEGFCEFIIGFLVEDGYVGDVNLRGLQAVIAGKYPNAIHEGNGHIVLFVDEKANQQKVDAFASVLSGQLGGMPWEALAGTITRLEGPLRRPIQIKIDKEHSSVHVDGAVELQLTPLKDPVTGKDKTVQIVYPEGGFFWDAGNIATSEHMHAEHGDFKLEWPAKFAAVAEVNWTNQP